MGRLLLASFLSTTSTRLLTLSHRGGVEQDDSEEVDRL